MTAAALRLASLLSGLSVGPAEPLRVLFSSRTFERGAIFCYKIRSWALIVCAIDLVIVFVAIVIVIVAAIFGECCRLCCCE